MDSAPDPFAAFESERTIVKPQPRHAGAPAAPVSAGSASVSPEPAPADLSRLAALGPLVAAATPLLVLAAQLRALVQPSDPVALRAAAGDAVRRFDADARAAGVPPEAVLGARYVLCTALDEAVANTPWGVQSGWNKQSLLVQFHNETWGGEKVFQLMARLAQDVPSNRALLELIFCVLSLGFEGRYRVLDNGRSQLDAVRQRLAELIRKDRPPLEAELSPHWRGQHTARPALHHALPLWVVGTALMLVLSLAWFGARLALGQRSDATYAAVAALRVPRVPTPPPAAIPAAIPAAPRLARFLEREIREGLVTVSDEADRSVVRLRGDSFFASGQAEPMPRARPVLTRIAQALAEVPGSVLVTGHSDNVPMRSLRFPSNWQLSAARAEAVRSALSPPVAPERVRAEGRADAEPVAANDTAEGRSQNRRVDIVLFAGAGAGAAGREGAR